jgi:hypothetical protein
MQLSSRSRIDTVMVILFLGSVIAGILALTAHVHALAEPFDAEPHAQAVHISPR